MKKPILLASFLLCSTVAFCSEKQEKSTQTSQDNDFHFQHSKEHDQFFNECMQRYENARNLEWEIYEHEMEQELNNDISLKNFCFTYGSLAALAGLSFGIALLCQKAGIDF
ncbi:MAG TPA: hypothetical protein VLG50_00675 [Candidatus Saccharimonadales bacterium]|nr:hypothetical protein [Candidatus Saccharimonadales bacterium]